MEDIQKINFSLKHFESSKDKDFDKALMIYNDTIPVDTKTSTNEITFFVDNCELQKNRKMYFFGLYVNNVLMGFIETGYLKMSKTIIIDYIVLKDEYHLNSVFYPLFSLLQKFFSESIVDYDYIITEVSTKCIEDSVDSESFFSRKMLQIEDFRIANALYIQPKLGIHNEESSFEFQLMIKSSQPLVSLKTKTYLSIVKDIYYEHYKAWYQVVDKKHSEEYEKHIDEQYHLIEESLENCSEVSLGMHNTFCEYYKAPDCHYACSTAGFVSEPKKQSRPWLLFGIPLATILVFGLTFLVVKVLEKYQIASDLFAPIFAAITVIFTSIFTVAFTRINKQ
jgi:hypothetical protein